MRAMPSQLDLSLAVHRSPHNRPHIRVDLVRRGANQTQPDGDKFWVGSDRQKWRLREAPTPDRSSWHARPMARASLARVLRAADGAVVCERCEIPESAFGRARGLLGRDGLDQGGGMLIDRAGSVHMLFMRFPIDVVFLDRDRRVVGVRHGLRPWRLAGARRAVAALELPVGAAAGVGIREGDVLVLEGQED